MRGAESTYAFRGRDETEEPDSCAAGTLERADCGNCAPARGQHGIQHEEIPLARVARHLEVVVDGFERVVIAVEANMADPRGRHEPENALDHSQTGAKNGDECELLPTYLCSIGLLE